MILFYVALKWNVLSSVTVSSHLLFCDVKSFEGKRLPRRALTICLIGIDVVVMTIVWYYAVKRLIYILKHYLDINHRKTIVLFLWPNLKEIFILL